MIAPCFCCGAPSNDEASTNGRVWFDWCGSEDCGANIEETVAVQGPGASNRWKLARRETQQSITAWADATFGVPVTNASIVERARKELDELAAALAEDDEHPKSVEECADIVIVLSRLVERRGGDLMAEVDRKMAINRARTWTLDGNGHGQHVKGGGE